MLSGAMPTNFEAFFAKKNFSVKNFSISFCQTADYMSLRKNTSAAEICYPALCRQTFNHYSLKNFSISFC